MSVSSTDRSLQELLLKPVSLDPLTQPSIRSQVIVTEFRGERLVFPSTWVDEVLFFPRQKVLTLPFYRKPIVGIVPHQGDLVLLIEPFEAGLTEKKLTGHQENIRAMHLSVQVGDLAGTAILIDKIVGTSHSADIEEHTNLPLFEPDKISLDAFQPYRWV